MENFMNQLKELGILDRILKSIHEGRKVDCSEEAMKRAIRTILMYEIGRRENLFKIWVKDMEDLCFGIVIDTLLYVEYQEDETEEQNEDDVRKEVINLLESIISDIENDMKG